MSQRKIVSTLFNLKIAEQFEVAKKIRDGEIVVKAFNIDTMTFEFWDIPVLDGKPTAEGAL